MRTPYVCNHILRFNLDLIYRNIDTGFGLVGGMVTARSEFKNTANTIERLSNRKIHALEFGSSDVETQLHSKYPNCDGVVDCRIDHAESALGVHDNGSDRLPIRSPLGICTYPV